MGLNGTDLHINANFTYNWSWLQHCIKEKKNVLRAAGSSLKCYWKWKHKVKISYSIMGQEEKAHVIKYR